MDINRDEVRLMIVDDHPMFREGLRLMLETEPGFRVIGETGDAATGVKLAGELTPDILLLDLAMPSGSGIEALRELNTARRPIRTIVLTAEISTAQVVEALQLGARGVVLKGSSTSVLFESIRAVMKDGFWVGREMVADLVTALRQLLPHPAERARQQTFGLSSRELEILAGIVSGHSNKEIAMKFSLSDHTVKNHVTHIFDKLGVSNRVEATLLATAQHLVDDPV